MALLFTEQGRKNDPVPRVEPRLEPVDRTPATPSVAPALLRAVDGPNPMAMATASESILAAGLTIEGQIEGSGNVRVAGRFKGNVNVKGELTIEPGASVDGDVKAHTVFLAGEVRGQVISTSLIEFKESGTLIGDLKAGRLTVAAGSKMRGKVEFGWDDSMVESDMAGSTTFPEP
jgi:cytoskeletal protein CcmA (bactofilin family)